LLTGAAISNPKRGQGGGRKGGRKGGRDGGGRGRGRMGIVAAMATLPFPTTAKRHGIYSMLFPPIIELRMCL